MPVAADEAIVAPVIAHVNAATPQLSAVVGFVVARLREHAPAATVLDILPGQVIVGLVFSTTVTFWVQVAELPDPSVTVQTTKF